MIPSLSYSKNHKNANSLNGDEREFPHAPIFSSAFQSSFIQP